VNPSFRVLIVEDSEDDALLLLKELRGGGYEPVSVRVETAEAMKAALDEQEWDIVISDYYMPHFSAPDALRLLQETGLDLPFLVVSGSIGEEIAVEAMKAGANDYLMKGNLKRLCPAIERELREAQVRRERERTEEALHLSHRLLSIANRHREMTPLLSQFVAEVKAFTSCHGVGVRLPDEEGNIPYQAYEGFSQRFYELESPLSIKSDQCMCINVIKGMTNPELPYYTKGGSFFINGTTRFLATVSEEEKGKSRNVCNEFGYESVALVPIRLGERILGLIHVADPEENKLPLEMVEALEGVAMQLGAAIQRVRAEEALRQSEARYRAVMAQSADGIYLLDGDTKYILEANRAFAQMLGYTLEEMPGLSMYDFNAADREEMDRRFQGLLRGEAPPLIERQFRRKDGSLLPVWLSANLIFFGEKKVISTLVRDLTEKKAMEAQFLRAQRMESIGLLAGGIAHDLNNILTPILINTDLLVRAFPEQGQQMLSSIAASAQRGADIVKQILTFSRGMEGEYQFLSPKYVLKEMEHLLQETFPKSITIATEIRKDLWSLQGDPTQLHQVLLNLCLNAKDAMEKGGKLTLSAENLALDEAYAGMHPSAQAGPYLLFTVADTGKGIPPEHLDRIFDPFFTTKERGQGTGLGLSTVHGIVKGHGGFLNVYSELGRGTQFHVYLPASPTAEMAKAEKERDPLPWGQGELILVVEDEASIREITQAALEACGYQVMTAADGSEAVALYAQHGKEIRTVITDMAMPIMDGPATIRALQKMNPKIKVIATTGMDADKVVSEMNREVVKAFLQKPFTAERLLRTVAEVLKG